VARGFQGRWCSVVQSSCPEIGARLHLAAPRCTNGPFVRTSKPRVAGSSPAGRASDFENLQCEQESSKARLVTGGDQSDCRAFRALAWLWLAQRSRALSLGSGARSAPAESDSLDLAGESRPGSADASASRAEVAMT